MLFVICDCLYVKFILEEERSLFIELNVHTINNLAHIDSRLSLSRTDHIARLRTLKE